MTAKRPAQQNPSKHKPSSDASTRRLCRASGGSETPTTECAEKEGHKKIQRDGLKQLRLFEMKKVNALKDSVEAVASESSPPGAVSSGVSSCSGRQSTIEKANEI